MNFVILITVFGILFLGELGDKTQLIVFNIVLESEDKPYKIGIGASLGFMLIVTIGVIFGSVLTQFIPVSIIQIVSGIVFIMIGIIEMRDIKTLYYEMKDPDIEIEKEYFQEEKKNEKNRSLLSRLKKNPYFTGFISIFIMELGDKTQILTITLASIYNLPFEVWLGSFVALISLAWIGVFFGALLLKYVPKFYIKIVAVFVFIFIGFLLILTNII